jgi:hypothetical protein
MSSGTQRAKYWFLTVREPSFFETVQLNGCPTVNGIVAATLELAVPPFKETREESFEVAENATEPLPHLTP